MFLQVVSGLCVSMCLEGQLLSMASVPVEVSTNCFMPLHLDGKVDCCHMATIVQ